MIVYNYTPDGIFRDSEEAVESPLEKGVFLIPAGATDIEPPDASEGFHAVWNGEEWMLVEIPVEEPTQETNLSVEPKSQTAQDPAQPHF